MRFFDPNFKKNVLRYILQCFLTAVVVFIILLITDTISNMTVVASLGASSFIAFTMPHINASRSRYLIGGYIIGIICGVLMNYLNEYLASVSVEIFGHSPHIITCAFAVGIAIFIMTATNFEHPPAAALAMGLVIESDPLKTAIIAIISIIILSLIKTLIIKRLKNLL